MGVSGKSSIVSSVVAALCILVYFAAIAFGFVRIIANIGERRDLAEKDFYNLADRATSSSVFLGFMSEAYQATIKDFLASSETLEGIIITGSNGEFAFERYPGGGIVWVGSSPRFKTGVWLSSEPLYLPLGIEGQRNVTIQAVYGIIDYDLFQKVLKTTLLMVLTALIVAFLTLLVELTLKNKTSNEPSIHEPSIHEPSIHEPSIHSQPTHNQPLNYQSTAVPAIEPARVKPVASERQTQKNVKNEPHGLYNPRGNIGWESYTDDRLKSELHRCASFEQDLVLLTMELKYPEIISDSTFGEFTEEAVNFFTTRDLIFGKGENGIIVIMPNINLDHGIMRTEEFHNRIITKLPLVFASGKGEEGIELCIGISSRSGRLIEASRLMLESSSALEKAMTDPVSKIVAFKSDPEKYREFIKGNH